MIRRRVLLIAEAANPDWVSVPLVGWSLARALAEVADVHLVTQVRNREAILAAGLREGRDFTALDTEALARPLWKLGEALRMGEGRGWTTLQALAALGYPRFERMLWRRFGARIEAGEFDIVHRVTPLSPTIPSPVAARCNAAGVPFVLGPLNGGVPWPPGFDSARRAEREWLSYLRGAYKALPGRRATLRHAAAVIAASRHTEAELARGLGAARRDRLIYLPENGIDPARLPAKIPARPATGPLRACFIGRMVPYKGPDMLIEAARPLLRAGLLRLDMIGDGPMMPGLRNLGAGLEGLQFHGWLAHRRVQEVAAANHILAFPSIREFGGGVVLEAMALGLVPLVVDYAGPGELVDAEVGIKLPLGDRAQIVARLRAALEDLARDRAPLAAMSVAGRRRVDECYTWSAKARRIAGIYEDVLAPAPAEAHA